MDRKGSDRKASAGAPGPTPLPAAGSARAGCRLKGLVTTALSPRAVRGAVHELVGLATHGVLYPLGLLRAPVHQPPEAEGDTFQLPVVLVHGYFHNRSGFFFLARALRRRGFRSVYAFNYNPIGESVASLAARLARHVEEVLVASGAPRVHLVGHSLGGLVCRWYVQELGGGRYVDHCVTIGTPHRGTYMAYLGMGQAAREMRPGSSVLRRLERSLHDPDTKLVNLYSDLDVLIVPPSSAVLPETERIHNHLIADFGHTSLLVSPELIEVVCSHLAQASVHIPLAEVRPLRPRRVGGAAAGSAGSE